ncbi:hypothetical protein INR49_002793 [Caranx melampygus]|nr:hypothetical protein INR49_002793 [Caranx melampygus]
MEMEKQEKMANVEPNPAIIPADATVTQTDLSLHSDSSSSVEDLCSRGLGAPAALRRIGMLFTSSSSSSSSSPPTQTI